MTYEIYKLPLSSKYIFMDYKEELFDALDYVKVYSGISLTDLNHNEFLEYLFDRFNVDHPYDYHSSSMSVSDVICLIDNNIRYWYYVQPLGFKELAHDLFR